MSGSAVAAAAAAGVAAAACMLLPYIDAAVCAAAGIDAVSGAAPPA
jgi:hypothetical protein